MGFNFLWALGGAAKQYTADKQDARETQRRVMEDVLKTTQESADEAQKAWNAKRSNLTQLGKQLEKLGLDTDRALVVLDQGEEEAKKVISKLQVASGVAARTGKNFRASDFIELASPEATGLSLSQGIDNITGILSKGDSAGGEYTPKQKATISMYEEQFGVPFGELRKWATNDLEYGAIPQGTISGSLYEEEAMKQAILKSQTTSAEADASTAQEMADIRLRIAKSDAEIKEVTASNAEELGRKKIQALDIQISEGLWNEDTREAREAQRIEKANLEIAAAKQRFKGEELKQQLTKIELETAAEKAAADLAYTRAATADKEAGDTGVKASTLNTIYNSSLEAFSKANSEVFGEYVYNPETQKLSFMGGDESQRAAMLKQFHEQMFSTMVKNFGFQPAIIARFESSGYATDYKQLPSVAAGSAVTKASYDKYKNSSAILFDNAGQRVKFVEKDGKYGVVKY
jgi:hypothetical protein